MAQTNIMKLTVVSYLTQALKMVYSHTWSYNQIEWEFFVCLHGSNNSSKVKHYYILESNPTGTTRVEGLC